MQDRAPWNAGKKVGTKRPLSQKQIWEVRFSEGLVEDIFGAWHSDPQEGFDLYDYTDLPLDLH